MTVPSRLRVTAIAEAVAEAGQTGPRLIERMRRSRTLAPHRWAIMRLAREAGRSMPEIGRALGHVDHNSTFYGLQRSSREIAEGTALGRRTAELEAEARRRLAADLEPIAE